MSLAERNISTDLSVVPPAGPRLVAYQRVLLAAVVFMPLQQAFTIDVGFPLKISELLILLAVAMYALTPRSDRGAISRGLESSLVIALGGLVLLSAGYHLMVENVDGVVLRGYGRSLDVDLTLYTMYGLLVLVFWWAARSIPPEPFRKALQWSVWVAGAATYMQYALIQRGDVGLLKAFSFQTDARGFNLLGGDDTTRQGPFVEGQHLGFYAGAMLIICLRDRKWVRVAVCAWMLFYSQSTSGVLGLSVALVVTLLLRPSAGRFIKVVLAAIAAVGVALSIPVLRTFMLIQAGKIGIINYSQFGDRALSTSLDIRTLKTNIAFEIARDHPLLGVGPGRYGIYFFDYPDASDAPSYYFRTDHRAIAENVYAHIASELGLIALLVFVALIVLTIFHVPRNLASEFALAVYVGVAVSTQSSWTFLPIWMLLAYLNSTARQAAEVNGAPVRLGRRERRAPRVPQPARGGRWVRQTRGPVAWVSGFVGSSLASAARLSPPGSQRTGFILSPARTR